MIKAVTSILNNDATIQALIGLNSEGVKTKVYPVVVPNSEKSPYITVTLTSKTYLAKGCSYSYGFQVNCWDVNYDKAIEIADAVTSVLTGCGSGSVNGYNVSFINFTSESDTFDKDYNLFGKIVSFEGVAIEAPTT